MTCKDCLYYECCNKWHDLIADDVEGVQNRCDIFKEKSRFTEVKHEKWISARYKGGITGGGNPIWGCSNCGYVYGASMKKPSYNYCPNCGAKTSEDEEPAYNVGDLCIYKYDTENKSMSIVKIVNILDDARGVAEIKFVKVLVDDTGYYDYLLKTGHTMNASLKYLHKLSKDNIFLSRKEMEQA